MKKEIIGDCTLYLGDCMELMESMPDKSVDAVVTDPPYGLNIEYASFVDTPENVQALAEKWLPEAIRVSNSVAFTPGIGSHAFYPTPEHIACWLMEAGGYRSSWGFGMWQPILCYGKDRYLATRRGARPDVVRTNSTDGKFKPDHPCPKPEKVWHKIIDRFSIEGDVVFDPFMGSGTGGVNSINLGRKFIGCEIEPKYFDIACKRIEQANRQLKLF